MPEDFKEVILIPRLKRSSLDHEVLSYLIPISNLAYISKCNKKCDVLQVTNYTVVHGLYNAHQSRYNQYRTQNSPFESSILLVIDKRQTVVLVCMYVCILFSISVQSMI